MRELSLRDPRRRRADWTGDLQEGEYVLFVTEVVTGAHLTANGEANPLGIVYVFTGLDEASAFARECVERDSKLACDVFTHEGKARPAVYRLIHPRFGGRFGTRRSARRMMFFALSSLLPIGPLLWLDWSAEWLRIWPTLLAINFFLLALRLLWWVHGMNGHSADAREKPLL